MFLKEAGKSFITINVHKSMLSTTLPPIDGFRIGSHPLVKKLISSCYNLNPPQPRYTSMWDPNVVLEFIAAQGENEPRSLAYVTRKTAVLVVLASLLRVSELAAINFLSGPLQTISLPGMADEPGCPARAMRDYKERTVKLRTDSNSSFFLGLIPQHVDVSANTISRWVKEFLKTAGVDTAIFLAHSTRGAAASSAAAKCVAIDNMLRAGNWARESTFRRFYDRRIVLSIGENVADTTND